MIKKVVLPIICLASIATFVIANSFAWFTENNTKTPTINGSTPTAYYKSGDGTKDNPYIIARPVHLYNFAWLQYMGTYNKVDDEGTVKQTYFKIDDDLATDTNGNKILDMSGYVLPPLGTEDNPFVGNFDGNGTIITNLTISNKLNDYSRHPASVTNSSFDAPQVIGLFGVVGATDTSKIYEYTSTTDEIVHDVYAENLTIKNDDTSSNKQTLAGLLAGYVNAPILNCGLGLGTFDLASGTTSLGTYNGTTLKGVSDYALVGSYNSENFSWTIPDGGGSGQGNDFGGSIDFASISKRITYIIDNIDTTTTDSSGKNYSSDKFNTNIYVRNNQTVDNKTSDYAWDTFKSGSTSMQTAFLEEGTFLPLNIDESKATIDGKATTMGSYYSDTSTNFEPILNSNTGYLVGADSSTNASPRIQHRAGNASSGIQYSLITQDNGVNLTNYSVFNSSNISFFYLDYSTTNSSYTTKRILDDDNKNGTTVKNSDNNDIVYNYKSYSNSESKVDVSSLDFKEYSSVKSNLIESLKKATNSSVLSDGRITINSILFNKTSEAQKTITKSGIKINDGKNKGASTYDNYALLTGGLNFSLSKSGIMTFISANMTGTDTASLPPLLKIERNSDKSEIKSKSQIYKVYKKDNTYEYTFNDNDTVADGTLVIDLYKLTNQSYFKRNCAYYFEVPLLPGDYYFGADSSGLSYTYFLYLDIGANAGDSGDEDDDSSPWPIDFVYFDSNKTLVKISTDKDSSGNYIYKNSEALFQINETASGIIKFKRKDGDGSVVYYYISSSSSITVVAIATEGKYEISTSDLTPIYTTSN